MARFTCTRKGCRVEYDEETNSADACTYHSGAPVFHEGLKSWSCCQNVNKPVLAFDDFMKIPGCTTGSHTTEVQTEAPKPVTTSNANLTMTGSDNTKESYTTKSSQSQQSVLGVSAPPTPPPKPVVEEVDDLSIAVPAGTKCRRYGCTTLYESDEKHRNDGGEESVCTYHASPPLFHEGSKGYLCCKRRVLEFDEFLKIQGCKTGRHVFAPKTSGLPVEELTTCRIDHYQTLTTVHVSVFAKKTDKERSTVNLEEGKVTLDLILPDSKRFTRTLELFGSIDVSASSVQYFGTKVELHLKKQDNRSWTVLEKTDQDFGNIAFTFGVGGRTGSVGAKELQLDADNQSRS